MPTLTTLPEDALSAIMRFLDAPALVALAETSTHFRAVAGASRAIWIHVLRATYVAHGAAPPDTAALLLLSPRDLRRRALRPHRARQNLARRAPRPTHVRRAPAPHGLAGSVVAFKVVPGGDYVFVAENDVDWGTIVLWALPDVPGPARVAARLDFDRPLCCTDVQLSEDGAALEIVVSVAQVDDQCFAHLVFRLDIPTSRESACDFVLVAELRNDKVPRYLSLSEDWVAMNVGGGELVFWAWKADQRVHVVVDDALSDSPDGWALHFRHPHAFVFDTGAGVMRQYTLPPPTPLEAPSDNLPQRTHVVALSASSAHELPAVWRGNMALWMQGAALPCGPTTAFVHAGIADDRLLHCVLPAADPFCLSHGLPGRIGDDAAVVALASLGDALLTLVDDAPAGGLHAFLTAWADLGGAPAYDGLARRTAGFKKLLDVNVVRYEFGVSPAGVDPISGRVVMVAEREDTTSGLEFVVADFA